MSASYYVCNTNLAFLVLLLSSLWSDGIHHRLRCLPFERVVLLKCLGRLAPKLTWETLAAYEAGCGRTRQGPVTLHWLRRCVGEEPQVLSSRCWHHRLPRTILWVLISAEAEAALGGDTHRPWAVLSVMSWGQGEGSDNLMWIRLHWVSLVLSSTEPPPSLIVPTGSQWGKSLQGRAGGSGPQARGPASRVLSFTLPSPSHTGRLLPQAKPTTPPLSKGQCQSLPGASCWKSLGIFSCFTFFLSVQ